MTAHAGWLLRHVGSTDTYALYNASMGTDTRVAQTSTTTKDGTPQASAGVLLPLHEEHWKSTVGLEQRVKRLPPEQFDSACAAVAANVIRHTPADHCRSIQQRAIL